MPNKLDIGDRIGNLVITRLVGPDLSKPGNYLYEAQCSCGGVIIKTGHDIRFRKFCSRSCAAKHKAVARWPNRSTVDGVREKLYGAWNGMKQRCEYRGHVAWDRYGGRGIKVCDEWQDYWVFRAWAMSHGYKEGLTLDRLNTKKGYEPSNCEYVTQAENTRRARNGYYLIPRDLSQTPDHFPTEAPWGES